MRGTGPRTTVGWRFFDPFRDLASPNYRCEGPFPVGQDRLILTPFGLRRSRITDARPPTTNKFDISTLLWHSF